MVAERASGARRIYYLQERGMNAVREYLERLWGEAARVSGCWPRTPRSPGTMTAPLRMSFDVDCSAEHAFAVWTSGIGTWWPADHTVTGEAELTSSCKAAWAGGSTSARPTAGSMTGAR